MLAFYLGDKGPESDRGEAKKVLDEADGNMKTSIVMVLTASLRKRPKDRLEKAGGHVRNIDRQGYGKDGRGWDIKAFGGCL